MKFCSQCGQGNADDATFCVQCGSNLKAEGAPAGAVTGGAAPPAPPGAAATPPTGPPPPAPGPPVVPHAGPAPIGPPRQTDGMAVASLAMGIGSFLVCPLLCAILAIVFGYMARKNIEESGGVLEGDGFAVAGIILGWVNIGVVALVAIIFIIIAVAVSSAGMTSMIVLAGLPALGAL